MSLLCPARWVLPDHKTYLIRREKSPHACQALASISCSEPSFGCVQGDDEDEDEDDDDDDDDDGEEEEEAAASVDAVMGYASAAVDADAPTAAARAGLTGRRREDPVENRVSARSVMRGVQALAQAGARAGAACTEAADGGMRRLPLEDSRVLLSNEAVEISRPGGEMQGLLPASVEGQAVKHDSSI